MASKELQQFELEHNSPLQISEASNVLFGSEFRLDKNITAGILKRFASSGSRFDNTEIIGALAGRKVSTEHMGGKAFHILPVLSPFDPDVVDWSQPLSSHTPEFLNYQAVSFLFNIATCGSVKRPEALSAPLTQATNNPASSKFPTWLRNPLTNMGGSLVEQYFRHREALSHQHTRDEQQRLIAETAAYQQVIIDKDRAQAL